METKYHECDAIPIDEVDVIYCDWYTKSDEMRWILVVTRYATEEDVEENTMFYDVGDTKWQTILEIYNCPYCGESLYKESNQKPDDVSLLHYDHSKWK